MLFTSFKKVFCVLAIKNSKGVSESCIQVCLFYFTKKEGILKEATQNSKK